VEEEAKSRAVAREGEGIGWCDRTTLEMRGSSPKIISGDSRRSKNTQT
jgi:hypothetical protein